jgi:hypothetical protein
MFEHLGIVLGETLNLFLINEKGKSVAMFKKKGLQRIGDDKEHRCCYKKLYISTRDVLLFVAS